MNNDLKIDMDLLYSLMREEDASAEDIASAVFGVRAIMNKYNISNVGKFLSLVRQVDEAYVLSVGQAALMFERPATETPKPKGKSLFRRIFR